MDTIGPHNHPAEVYEKGGDLYREHLSEPAKSPLHAYYEKPAMHALLAPFIDQSVLSLGCGSGDDAAWIRGAGAASVTGIDISRNLIDSAQKHYPDVTFRVMDMSELDFEDDSFDLAFSSLAIHYVADWTRPLSEARRVIKPGSRFVFSCMHPLETALEYAADDQSRTALLGRTITQATEERKIHGDYLVAGDNGARLIERTIADDQPVEYYHRPFSKMVEDIVATGFRIQKLVEPEPLQEMAATNPEHYKQVSKIPKFVIWVVEKPE